MYVCMYIYMYVCMYVCKFVDMQAYMYVCMYVCKHVCVCVYGCIYIYILHNHYTCSVWTLCCFLDKQELLPFAYWLGGFDEVDYVVAGRKEMFYLTTHSTHFILWLYSIRHVAIEHS